MRFFRPFPYSICILLLLICSCGDSQKQEKVENGAFAKAKIKKEATIDRIVSSGELIIGTISSPETYFDYQGVAMGLQYALAEDFASSLGVGVRVVLENDTTQLIKKLKEEEIDLIALQLPQSFVKKEGLKTAGASNEQKHTAWAVKANATDLAENLNDWFGDGVEVNVEKKENKRYRERREIHRTVRAPFISREKGIISTYDNYFKEAARYTGWDWRLIAAQCYQESGFDPNAVSWAGAKGLMQIMPQTAKNLGLPENKVFSPMENIAAAARLIRQLQGEFTDIPDAEERVKFVLASYNGGSAHIRDAQALVRKYGGNPNQWSNVAFYVRGLMQPRYYRDPVVRHGYMIGSETAGYVESIMERWRAYGGDVRHFTSPSNRIISSSTSSVRNGSTQQTSRKHNRYNKQQKILSAEEMQKESTK